MLRWLQRHFEAQRERLGKRAVFIFLVLLLVLFVLYAAGTANIGTLTVQRVRLRSEIR